MNIICVSFSMQLQFAASNFQPFFLRKFEFSNPVTTA